MICFFDLLLTEVFIISSISESVKGYSVTWGCFFYVENQICYDFTFWSLLGNITVVEEMFLKKARNDEKQRKWQTLLFLSVPLCQASASHEILIKRPSSWSTFRALLCDSSILSLSQNKKRPDTSPGLSLQQAELEQYFWAWFLPNTLCCMTSLSYSNLTLHCIGKPKMHKIGKLSKFSFLVQAFFIDQQSLSRAEVSILASYGNGLCG